MSKPLALIAEDDPKLGMIYELTLQKAGYDTFLDVNGDQIMHKLAAVDPALIILDMHLPYASGADLLHQIRADARWANTPVIVATADIFSAKSLTGKAEYVLTKPVSVGRLLEIISQIQNAEQTLDDKGKVS